MDLQRHINFMLKGLTVCFVCSFTMVVIGTLYNVEWLKMLGWALSASFFFPAVTVYIVKELGTME